MFKEREDALLSVRLKSVNSKHYPDHDLMIRELVLVVCCCCCCAPGEVRTVCMLSSSSSESDSDRRILSSLSSSLRSIGALSSSPDHLIIQGLVNQFFSIFIIEANLKN